MKSEKNSIINILPEHIINQIKAGEVIERPANIVKELIENALDAQSTEIDIHIVQNGIEFISIIDNGTGMEAEQLPKAFYRHATSKIDKFEDLYGLNSFGFRGEALASIASVSRVQCLSAPKADPSSGAQVNMEAGVQAPISPYSQSHSGTSFFIKDLFFNTPVRLKFIRSSQSEKNAIDKIILSFIVANPEVKFTVKWDEKDKKIYPKAVNHEQRIKQVFFKNKKQDNEIIYIENEYEQMKLKSYFSVKSSKGGSGKQQYLFVNQRLCFDKQIHQIILRTMDNVWGMGQSGHYVLFIDLPPRTIDVNVHPRKTTIKFQNPSEVFSLVSASIKNKLKDIQPTDENMKSLESYSKESSFSYDETQSYPKFNPIVDTASTNMNYFQIGHFGFLKKDGLFYMLSTFSLFKDHLKKVFEQGFPGENEITPLLISEPFHFTLAPDIISQFKKRGFHIEQLENNTILLRSIPSSFDKSPFLLVLKDFFFMCNKYSSYELAFKHLVEKISKDMYVLELRFINRFISDESKDKYLKEINQNKIRDLWKSSGNK